MDMHGLGSEVVDELLQYAHDLFEMGLHLVMGASELMSLGERGVFTQRVLGKIRLIPAVPVNPVHVLLQLPQSPQRAFKFT